MATHAEQPARTLLHHHPRRPEAARNRRGELRRDLRRHPPCPAVGVSAMRVRELFARLHDRLHRERLTAELSEELQHHRALLERNHATDRTIGNRTYYREETRARWSLGLFDDLLQALR